MGYLENYGGHLSFYAVGLSATLGLVAFFSWSEPLILVKAAGFFVAFFGPWPSWRSFGGSRPSRQRASEQWAILRLLEALALLRRWLVSHIEIGIFLLLFERP